MMGPIVLTTDELQGLLETAYKEGWYGCLELAEETSDALVQKHLEKRQDNNLTLAPLTYPPPANYIFGIDTSTPPAAPVEGWDAPPPFTINVDVMAPETIVVDSSF